MTKSAHAAVILALAGAASFASADIVEIAGWSPASTEQTGATFAGSIEYAPSSESSGDLLVTIANETPAEVGGFLTGFVFVTGSSDAGRSVELLSAGWAGFTSTGATSAPPFGMFDGGAALGGNWTGGGNPSAGLAPGDEASFVFRVNAADAGLLTASSFVGGMGDYGFVARFRGLADGGSDKVPVPTPASTALVLLGGVFASRRKR